MRSTQAWYMLLCLLALLLVACAAPMVPQQPQPANPTAVMIVAPITPDTASPLLPSSQTDPFPKIPPRGAPQLQPVPGKVSGRVTDAAGNPLAHVTVSVVQGTDMRQCKTSTFDSGETDANGLYSLDMPKIESENIPQYIFMIAEYRLTWNQRPYHFYLGPADKNQSACAQQAKEGNVYNFVWRISGPLVGTNDQATRNELVDICGGKTLDAFSTQFDCTANPYFGAYVILTDEYWYNSDTKNYQAKYTVLPDGATLEFTFTPIGKLIDGTQGKTIKRTSKTPWRGYGYTDNYLFDIPIGQYTLTATITMPDGTVKPLRLSAKVDTYSTSDYATQNIPAPATSTMIDFMPALTGVSDMKVYVIQ